MTIDSAPESTKRATSIATAELVKGLSEVKTPATINL
jgi:hypothetical protein